MALPLGFLEECRRVVGATMPYYSPAELPQPATTFKSSMRLLLALPDDAPELMVPEYWTATSTAWILRKFIDAVALTVKARVSHGSLGWTIDAHTVEPIEGDNERVMHTLTWRIADKKARL